MSARPRDREFETSSGQETGESGQGGCATGGCSRLSLYPDAASLHITFHAVQARVALSLSLLVNTIVPIVASRRH